jgi:predicted metal-binding protein
MTETPAAYAIVVCSRCRAGAAAPDLTARLALHATAGGFRVDTVACLAGCERPLAVAFTAASKATFLFGDIDPARDVDALLAFGRQYRDLPDGWCNEGQRPVGLRGKTLARIPHIGGLAG